MTFSCFGARGVVLFVACTTLAVVFGCSAKSEDLGGETNWLVSCERDDDCADMACRCGVCTTECSAPSDCSDLSAATCADGDSDASETQCGSSASMGICLPECTRDSDCSSDQRCAGGGCVLPDRGSSSDDSTADDSMPPSDDGSSDDGSSDDGSSDDGSSDDGSSDDGSSDDGSTDDGSGSSSNVENPTGDCVADGDGSRIGHSPGSDSEYLPDCELELSREYYRVFAQPDGTAYMIPRPDNHPDFVRACIDDQDPIHDTLQTYALCQSQALTSSQVERVNSMDPADALQITHFLHERLVFFVAEQGVAPFPQPQDILDLCKADESFRSGPMQERCEYEFDAEESGRRGEIGWVHTGEEAEALAPALNELYGITDDELCDRLSNAASLDVTRVVYGTSQSCSDDEDCVQVGHASACHDACGAVISLANQDEFDATVQRVSNEQCATREAAECGPIIAPPCIPPLAAACIDGQCVEDTGEDAEPGNESPDASDESPAAADECAITLPDVEIGAAGNVTPTDVGLWIFTNNNENGEQALFAGQAGEYCGCLTVDGVVVVWDSGAADYAEELATQVQAGESPDVMGIGGGGSSIVPPEVMERCPTDLVFYQNSL